MSAKPEVTLANREEFFLFTPIAHKNIVHSQTLRTQAVSHFESGSSSATQLTGRV